MREFVACRLPAHVSVADLHSVAGGPYILWCQVLRLILCHLNLTLRQGRDEPYSLSYRPRLDSSLICFPQARLSFCGEVRG